MTTCQERRKKQVAPYKAHVGNKIKIAEPSVSYAGKTTVANDANVLSNHSAISVEGMLKYVKIKANFTDLVSRGGKMYK